MDGAPAGDGARRAARSSIDPGEHAFRFGDRRSASLEQAAGAREGEKDRRERHARAGGDAPVPGPSTAPSGPSSWTTQRTLAVIGGGLGVVGLGVGAVFGGLALSDQSQEKSNCSRRQLHQPRPGAGRLQHGWRQRDRVHGRVHRRRGVPGRGGRALLHRAQSRGAAHDGGPVPRAVDDGPRRRLRAGRRSRVMTLHGARARASSPWPDCASASRPPRAAPSSASIPRRPRTRVGRPTPPVGPTGRSTPAPTSRPTTRGSTPGRRPMAARPRARRSRARRTSRSPRRRSTTPAPATGRSTTSARRPASGRPGLRVERSTAGTSTSPATTARSRATTRPSPSALAPPGPATPRRPRWASRGAVFDGRYVYFIPYLHGVVESILARYDTLGAFNAADAWTTFNLATLSADGGATTSGFFGGAFDGRYVFFIPRNDGAPDGRVLRYDSQASADAAAPLPDAGPVATDAGDAGAGPRLPAASATPRSGRASTPRPSTPPPGASPAAPWARTPCSSSRSSTTRSTAESTPATAASRYGTCPPAPSSWPTAG